MLSHEIMNSPVYDTFAVVDNILLFPLISDLYDVDGMNIYAFIRNSPVFLVDILGMYSSTEGGCLGDLRGCSKKDRRRI